MTAERADLGLFQIFGGEDAEDDGNVEFDADFGEAVGDGVGDVVVVFGVALDKDANTDDSVISFSFGEGGGGDGELE